MAADGRIEALEEDPATDQTAVPEGEVLEVSDDSRWRFGQGADDQGRSRGPGDVKGHLQRERGLAGARIAEDHDDVALTHAPAEQCIQVRYSAVDYAAALQHGHFG